MILPAFLGDAARGSIGWRAAWSNRIRPAVTQSSQRDFAGLSLARE